MENWPNNNDYTYYNLLPADKAQFILKKPIHFNYK